VRVKNSFNLPKMNKGGRGIGKKGFGILVLFRKGFRQGNERGEGMYVRHHESGISVRQAMVGASLIVAVVFPFTGMLGWAGSHRDMGKMELSKPPLPVSRMESSASLADSPSCSPISGMAFCEAGLVGENVSR